MKRDFQAESAIVSGRFQSRTFLVSEDLFEQVTLSNEMHLHSPFHKSAGISREKKV